MISQTILGASVALLSPSEVVSESELWQNLHLDDQVFAHSLAAPKRQLEFLRTRYLMRQCMVSLPGLPTRTETGIPLFFSANAEPISGSVTHKDGWVAVAWMKANDGSNSAVGIDLEVIDRVTAKVGDRVMRPEEKKMLEDTFSDLDSSAAAQTRTAIFALKEALFKCHFPRGKIHFYFQDAMVTSLPLFEGSRAVVPSLLQLKIDAGPHAPAGTVTEGVVLSVEGFVLAVVRF